MKQGDQIWEFVFFDVGTPDNAGRSLPRRRSTAYYRIWELSFDIGTPEDVAYYRREPAETLLDCLLAECNQFACLVSVFLFMFTLFLVAFTTILVFCVKIDECLA